eukprot:GHVH01002671.1.p1 GENE.GHVH01002671.1~~GHVH01002671.1.p1  ORF type:complete len:508 (+),score=56.15 GHVH01002671.1:42-1565(+)
MDNSQRQTNARISTTPQESRLSSPGRNTFAKVEDTENDPTATSKKRQRREEYECDPGANFAKEDILEGTMIHHDNGSSRNSINNIFIDSQGMDQSSQGIFGSIFSTDNQSDSVFRSQSRLSFSQRSNDVFLARFGGKNVDWAQRRSARLSSTTVKKTRKAKMSIFSGVSKILRDIEWFPHGDGDVLEWAMKTYGLACRAGEVDQYLNPNEWLFDNMKVDVEVINDIPFSGSMTHTVQESSRLEREGFVHDATFEDDSFGSGYVPMKIDQNTGVHRFSPEVASKMETLAAGTKCNLTFSGYKSMISHNRMNGDLPPVDVILPGAFQTPDVMNAFRDDSLDGACHLGLRGVDPNLMETGLRIAALSYNRNPEFRNCLLLSASKRMNKIIRLAQEDCNSRLVNVDPLDRSRVPKSTAAAGATGSAINRIERLLQQQSHHSSGANKGGGVARRQRRGSIIKSGDDEKSAFIEDLSNSERIFNERYRRQLDPLDDATDSIFDNMIIHLSEVS